ncbi:Hypothetical predicted protein [Mytilus galloprovincialis]|uniref:Uncharacterized protein n=1 Tax=Mytilus galloprovincialis TaxID=29158 RepID=A0A8B6FJ73_MYTGA|nr:Hypothetical predicted protein [Mytilus galloprovincialis]
MHNGENGRGVTFVGEEKKKVKELLKKHRINVLASDIIPLNRLVPDSRPHSQTSDNTVNDGNKTIMDDIDDDDNDDDDNDDDKDNIDDDDNDDDKDDIDDDDNDDDKDDIDDNYENDDKS